MVSIIVIIVIATLLALLNSDTSSNTTTQGQQPVNQQESKTVNECGYCPYSPEWSACVNGVKSKEVFTCDQSTGFQCQRNVITEQCGPPKPPIQQQADPNPNISGNLSNNELFKLRQDICSKIDPLNPQIRNTAASIAGASPGEWGVNQLVELYLWMKENIHYVSDPARQEYFASATETLKDKAGDCEDQAMLASSLINSVGGTSKVVFAYSCSHAFASVFISASEEEFNAVEKTIADIYWRKEIFDLSSQSMFGYKDDQGYWLIVDPAGGYYLGDTYAGCRAVNSFYPINCAGIVPKLDAAISQCGSSFNVSEGLGEVTDVYATVTNSGAYDLHNVSIVAHASDEDKPFKNSANYSVLQVGQTASVKLTLDTQQSVQTLVTLSVTSDEGVGAEIQRTC